MLQRLKIAAPVTSLDAAEQVLDAGADELYFGLLLPEWIAEFDDADLWSRRQGTGAHVSGLAEARAIAEVAAAHGKSAALAVNARYSQLQIKRVLDVLRGWEEAGGEAAIISDVGVLAALDRRNSSLRRYLSLLTGVFNASSVEMFATLGICRVILPRELTINEMAVLIRAAPTVDYEALALFQRCPFIDGMCGFHHRPRIPAEVPADFEYQRLPGKPLPITTTCDPEYEGHGCQLPWRTNDGPVRLPLRNDFQRPYCAACQLPLLQEAGVSVLKIAGRGYPTDVIVRAVQFLRDAIRLGETQAAPEELRQRYTETFGSSCGTDSCYYRTGAGA